jgi:hypothetical protein
MRTMRGSKGIVHIDIAELSQLLGEFRIVLLFFGVQAEVLQQQHLSRLKLAESFVNRRAYAIALDRTYTIVVKISGNFLKLGQRSQVFVYGSK